MIHREEEKRRGFRAQQLLEDDLFIEAFTKTREELLNAWEDSPARDVEAREAIYLSLKMLDKVKACIQEIIETGQLARGTLEER